MSFRTTLCDLLGIEYPIVQSGMGSVAGPGDYIPMWAGQGVGLIHNLPGAGEVVEAIIREARAALEALPGRIR